jgi:hypothetical protein
LVETRTAYHHLLAAIPEEGYERPTANPNWNIHLELFHITIAYKFLPQEMFHDLTVHFHEHKAEILEPLPDMTFLLPKSDIRH